MSQLTPTPKKTCRGCDKVLGVGFFRAQRRICKKCDYNRRDLPQELVAARRYRNKHRSVLNARSLAKARAFAVQVDALKTGSCSDCKVSFPPYVMDWDHVRGEKKYNIASLRTRYGSRRTMPMILEEIAKCDLVCSNCHRERTHQRHMSRRLP